MDFSKHENSFYLKFRYGSKDKKTVRSKVLLELIY